MKNQLIYVKSVEEMDHMDDNVLLITSNYFNKINRKFLSIIEKKAKKIIIYGKVGPNPTLGMVIDSIQLLKKNNCNKIIALGGGSVIDVAKAVSIFYDTPKKDIWNYFLKKKDINNLKVAKTIIAIPTTFGTGSEHNGYSVITNNGEKRSIFSNLIVPDFVYKDEMFVKSLSLSQKVLGAFDCFMHAVECYISNKSTLESKKISLLCVDNIIRIINDFDNIKAQDIIKISELSGKVESLSSCISLHTLAHSISSLNSNIIHGEAVLLIAKKYFQCYLKLNENNITELNRYIKSNSKFDSLIDIINVFESIYYNIDKEKSNQLIFSFFELSKKKIIALAKKLSNINNNYFVNDPIKLNKKQLFDCLDIDFIDIKHEVLKYVKRDDIYFINSNCGINSYDTDIYCVVKGRGSSTHCYYDKNGKWVEIFIDSLENLDYKIKTVDALGINYASMLNFYCGNKKMYNDRYKKCMDIKQNYTLYKLDELLLTYRVQISFEKINKNNHEYSNKMLCSALIYPFISLLMGIYHVFPSSPKNWLSQLEKAMGEDFDDLSCLFDGKYDYEKIQKLIQKYTKKLEPIDLYFEGFNRRSRVE